VSARNSDDRTVNTDQDRSSTQDVLRHPERVGPYRVLQVLGEGGMGVVYEAEQTEPVKRRVALKLMKVGMDTKDVVARFEAERQALAVMEHPNIAQVFDAGVSETGRPYFVMEAVRGVPLTDYCDRHRLSTRDRLELFVPVCDAVQHAHQKGVIHRDLKPSNVIVSEQGGGRVPKIIDFGIAKATGQRLTEKTLVTEYGQAIGTPAYMSPEQAEMTGLDVDTRTDIYSLGVVLYEMLVGRLPVDPTEVGVPAFIARLVARQTQPQTPSARVSSLGNARDTVAESRQTDPGSLRKELKGDLDWIVMKAMESDRNRRYQTANALAFEIKRHLNEEPVLACPPSVRYRFSKFVRRHKAAVTASALVGVALVIGAALATIGMVRATRAERTAASEAEAARQVSDFLVGLFEVSDPGEARGNSITAREILDRGATDISADLAGQPVVQARLMATMGNVYRALGLYDEAAPLLEQSLAVRERELGPDDPDVAESLHFLGMVYGEQGRFSEAEPLLQRSLDIRERTLGPNDIAVANSVGTLGGDYAEQGRYEEAEVLLRRALEITKEQLGPEHPEVALALNNLGALYWFQRELADAEPLFERSLAIREKVLGSNHPELGEGLHNLGSLYYMQGKYDEAVVAYDSARKIFEQSLGAEHPNTAMIINNIAETYWVQGKYNEAEAYFKASLAIKDKLFEPSHRSFAVSLHGLANVYRDQARYGEAEPLYQRALTIRETALEAGDPSVVETLTDFAAMLVSAGRVAEAERMAARAEVLSDSTGR
jgi:non-specific serine/threonine protein kinase/serine/threonine-protein kinase